MANTEDRLRNLQFVTEAALGRLDVDDLLAEPLDRVREILDADTAAVLLLDETSQTLVARAARGIEQEVRQGFRVPVGTGFAGTIAAAKHPVLLNRVDATTVANPVLWERGIRVMLGVPLLASEGRVLGVLHVGRLSDAPFTTEDTELLQVVAERVAGAAQARQLAVERAAAGQLERSLLPAILPAPPGIELASRYVTAEDRPVGGDWYDAFVLPSGQLWVVVGDVAGHGLHAAIVMGRVRSTLRAYALLGSALTEVIELTNQKLLHFESGSMVTVVCAVLAPPFDEVEIAIAGHLPPILAAPDEGASLVKVNVSPPLGVDWDGGRSSATVSLPQGGLLLFFTDGLIERRQESLEVGLDRLRSIVIASDPEVMCRTIMHQLIDASGPQDDVAVVALRRSVVPE